MSVPVQLVVGLGNPGADYAMTRHNVGFMVADAVAEALNSKDREKQQFKSLIRQIRVAGRTVVIAKPLTFMNRSGDAIVKLVNAFDLTPGEVFVIYDCLDLPLGRLRIRQTGGSGGHRGMDSVLAALGTQTVPRLRVGIGRQNERDAVDHVLSPWSNDETRLVKEIVEAAADAVLMALRAGVERTMNTYNVWKPSEHKTVTIGTDRTTKETGN
ncbi:MAG: aminoacyl-tRNA hydrolase [Candidatus Pacebacteria bacterium]|nr:aminoacyl-tRNA hydrolase [Candidatus Paceibacterota bacterium]